MDNPKLYTYEEIKLMSKKRLPADVDRDRLEVKFNSVLICYSLPSLCLASFIR